MDLVTTAARSAHDLGLAAWFGESLVAAAETGHDGIAPEATAGVQLADPTLVHASELMAVKATAIAAYLAGSVPLTIAYAPRLLTQRPFATTAAAKLALTAVALGVTGYAGVLQQRVKAGPQSRPGGGAAEVEQAEERVAQARRRLRRIERMAPWLTGGMLLLDAVMTDQQRRATAGSRLGERVGHALHVR